MDVRRCFSLELIYFHDGCSRAVSLLVLLPCLGLILSESRGKGWGKEQLGHVGANVTIFGLAMGINL